MKNRTLIILTLLVGIAMSSCGSKTDTKANESQDTTKAMDSTTVAAKKLTEPTEVTTFKKEVEEGKRKVDFHGIGTEPFWDIYLCGEEMLYIDNVGEVMWSCLISPPFDRAAKRQVITYQHPQSLGIDSVIIIHNNEGSDGMSNRTYPYSVKLAEYIEGGGDAKKMNLSDYDGPEEN
jgi:uncharacterized membrane protein